ncbi:MAG: thioredoxin fold domain-containing protein [Polaromonas sp.]|nr:thioredoxin fold domain-containing protein [Polaromonas sp.]
MYPSIHHHHHHHLHRRQALALAAALPLLAFAKDSALPVPNSLQDVASEAIARGEPLVLLVSLPGCPYCELVRRNYLLPMRQDGLAAWQITVNDQTQKIRDFQGQAATGALLAAQLKIRVTPTVLFFNAEGKEIAIRIQGIAVPDFYGAYLEEALNTARQHLKSAQKR